LHTLTQKQQHKTGAATFAEFPSARSYRMYDEVNGKILEPLFVYSDSFMAETICL